MMAILTANPAGTLFHAVCRECLWTTQRPVGEDDAFRAADTHKPECPGEIPATRNAAQQRYARKLLNGNY